MKVERATRLLILGQELTDLNGQMSCKLNSVRKKITTKQEQTRTTRTKRARARTIKEKEVDVLRRQLVQIAFV